MWKHIKGKTNFIHFIDFTPSIYSCFFSLGALIFSLHLGIEQIQRKSSLSMITFISYACLNQACLILNKQSEVQWEKSISEADENSVFSCQHNIYDCSQ